MDEEIKPWKKGQVRPYFIYQIVLILKVQAKTPIRLIFDAKAEISQKN